MLVLKLMLVLKSLLVLQMIDQVVEAAGVEKGDCFDFCLRFLSFSLSF